MSTDSGLTPVAPTATVNVTAPAPIKAFSDGNDGPSFKDVLDIINPLQHIPIINTIYRHLTGDEEGAVADVAGGALFAGPIGLVGSMIDLAVKADSGKSIGDNILSWLGFDDDDKADAATAQAQTQQAQQAQQTAAAVAPPPAVTIQALAPLPARLRGDDKGERKETARRDDAEGPAKIGDFMVFGAAGSGQPLSLTPSQPAAPAMASAPSDKDAAGPGRQGDYLVFGGAAQPKAEPALSASTVQTASADTGIGHQGDYWVFGATASAASSAHAVQLAQAAAYVAPSVAAAPMPPVSTSVTANTPLPPISSATANAVANSVPPGGGPAQLSPVPSRFAAPARRTQVTPNSMGVPTTGPAAIPGHSPSQAIPSQVGTPDTSWFVSALNAGLDKYAAAARLGGQDNTAASAVAGSQSEAIH